MLIDGQNGKTVDIGIAWTGRGHIQFSSSAIIFTATFAERELQTGGFPTNVSLCYLSYTPILMKSKVLFRHFRLSIVFHFIDQKESQKYCKLRGIRHVLKTYIPDPMLWLGHLKPLPSLRSSVKKNYEGITIHQPIFSIFLISFTIRLWLASLHLGMQTGKDEHFGK